MEQKDYRLEIILFLLKKKDSIRKIARILTTNHVMINRKMKELLEENVVDYIQQGRNKIYYLKNTIEAKIMIFIAENYALLKTIKKYPQLRRIIQKIQENKKIKLALLFGSYAKGLAKKNSDIDIFIETKNLDLKRELSKIDSKLSIKIGKYNKNNSLIKEINRNHIIIKGIEEFYEKLLI